MERDFTSNVKVKAVNTLSVTALSAPEVVQGTAIDTLGARGLVCGIEAGEAIGTDVINATFYECDTVGGTYTVVDSSKILPLDGSTQIADKDSANNLIRVGVVDTKRFVKPAVATTTVADDLTVNVYPVLFMGLTADSFISTEP